MMIMRIYCYCHSVVTRFLRGAARCSSCSFAGEEHSVRWCRNYHGNSPVSGYTLLLLSASMDGSKSPMPFACCERVVVGKEEPQSLLQMLSSSSIKGFFFWSVAWLVCVSSLSCQLSREQTNTRLLRCCFFSLTAFN